VAEEGRTGNQRERVGCGKTGRKREAAWGKKKNQDSATDLKNEHVHKRKKVQSKRGIEQHDGDRAQKWGKKRINVNGKKRGLRERDKKAREGRAHDGCGEGRFPATGKKKKK